MTTPDSIAAGAAAVRDAVGRVLACDDFARAPRLTELLRFIVDEQQAGRGDRLKAFVIAQAVFGRDETFDAQNDTIVRVEMGRLRRRLEHYYLTAGADDPLRIEIPRGSYLPVYNVATSASTEPDETTVPRTPEPAAPEQRAAHRFRSPQLFLGASLVLIAILMVGWLATRPGGPNPDPGLRNQPFVAVLPLLTLTSSEEERRIATGLIEAIITDLARLKNLSVMAHSSVLGMSGENVSLVSLREAYGATHVLRGSVHHEAPSVRIYIHLIDTTTGRIVWAYRNEQLLQGTTLKLESDVALQIASSMSAVVESDEEALIHQRLPTDFVSLALYREALTVMNPPFDPSRVESARLIFKRLSAADPNFPGGAAGLGFTHVVAVMSRWSPHPAEDLELGFKLAREAIEIDDGFAMGHATLGFAHAMAGNSKPALAAAAAALARQPGDAMVQFTAGMIRSILRQHVESIPYFEEALRLDPAEPRAPYLNLLGIAYITLGEFERGVTLLERNINRGGPYSSVHDIYRALAYAELGRISDARAALQAGQNGPNPIEPADLLDGLFGPGVESDRALELVMELGYAPPVRTSRATEVRQP